MWVWTIVPLMCSTRKSLITRSISLLYLVGLPEAGRASLSLCVFHDMGIFDEYRLGTEQAAPPSGFVWVFLVVTLGICMFNRASAEAVLCFLQGCHFWGYMMSACLITGDVSFNHLVKAVSARFPLKIYSFIPF